MNAQGMNILVTGSDGQLGTELRSMLPYFFPDGHLVFANSKMLDVTQRAVVEEMICANRISHIVNCAAYTAVDHAEAEPDKAMLVNTCGSENLAIAAKQYGARLIHISTDYVFSGTSSGRPYSEDDAPLPAGVYGRSKLEGELRALGVYPDNTFVLRTGWLYSQYGHNFVKTMLALARSNPQIRVVDDQTGTPTWTRDLAHAIMLVLKASNPTPGIYHFANEGSTTWHGFAKKIFELAGMDVALTPVSTAEYGASAPRPAYSVLNKTKFYNEFNYRAQPWEQALAQCLGLMLPPPHLPANHSK